MDADAPTAAAVPLPSSNKQPSKFQGAEDVVTANIVELCKKMVPTVTDDTIQYCMKILGSRLATGPTAVRSELHVLAKIRKLVERRMTKAARDATAAADQNTNPQQAKNLYRKQRKQLRVLEEAVQRVRQSTLVKQNWAILQLLYSLRNAKASAAGGPFRTIEPLSGAQQESSPADDDEPSNIFDSDAALPSLRAPRGDVDGGLNEKETRQAAMAKSHGYRIGSFSHELSEQLLLRDIVFALQGIDGEYIKYDSSVKGYVVDAGVGVPGSTRQLIRKICEGGWLFRQVSTFLARCNASHTTGLVHQGMCQAMQTEITEYYRLIAVLKEQVNIDIAAQGPDVEQLSLRRLYIWMQDPIERLRLMASLAHGTGSLHGGALASAVHSHTRHGDPFVNQFITSQMTALAAPILDMTRQWVVEVRT